MYSDINGMLNWNPIPIIKSHTHKIYKFFFHPGIFVRIKLASLNIMFLLYLNFFSKFNIHFKIKRDPHTIVKISFSISKFNFKVYQQDPFLVLMSCRLVSSLQGKLDHRVHERIERLQESATFHSHSDQLTCC